MFAHDERLATKRLGHKGPRHNVICQAKEDRSLFEFLRIFRRDEIFIVNKNVFAYRHQTTSRIHHLLHRVGLKILRPGPGEVASNRANPNGG